MRRRQSCRPCIDLGAREPASIFELAAHADGRLLRAVRLKANHQRSREWPRLRGVIANAMDGNPSFLRDLTNYCVLKALTGLDKSGDRRIAPSGPAGLSSKQSALAVAYHDDDRRIHAR